MTEQITIDQQNEVIAKFMGWERYEDESGIWFKREDMIKCMHPNIKDLKFHSEWNWLMPVVKKIAGLVLNRDWDNLQHALGRWKPICNELEKVNLENTHYCVYMFIQWLNNQQR